VRCVSWLLSQPFGASFIEVNPAYVSDPFNLDGLHPKVVHFRVAMTLIRGGYIPRLYRCSLRLLPARYLLISAGLRLMKAKCDSQRFEQCPVRCAWVHDSHSVDFPKAIRESDEVPRQLMAIVLDSGLSREERQNASMRGLAKFFVRRSIPADAPPARLRHLGG
jgi:hypothetical protein